MKTRHVVDLLTRSFESPTGIQRGDLEMGKEDAILCCPGCGEVLVLPFDPVKGIGPKWHFDGDRENPTMTPSIHHVGCWHGWLRGGELVTAQ